MTILRTVCPSCDVVRVKAKDATVRRREGSAHVEVAFTCPGCTELVVQHLSPRMLPLLVTAGCAVEPADPADVAGAISESEIRNFVYALDRKNWADELAH